MSRVMLFVTVLLLASCGRRSDEPYVESPTPVWEVTTESGRVDTVAARSVYWNNAWIGGAQTLRLVNGWDEVAIYNGRASVRRIR
jgi:hypothetical protein